MSFTFPTDSNKKAGAVRLNPGGTGFHVPVVLYDEDGVTPIKAHGKRKVYEKRTGILNAQTSEKVYETKRPFMLDSLEFATNKDRGVQVRIVFLTSGEEKSIEILAADGSDVLGFYPKDIVNEVSGIMKTLVYDDDKNAYKFALREPLFFPGGVIIQVKNWLRENVNAGVIIIGSEY